MAKLNKKKRDALPDSAFAIPEKRAYPINDKSHADNALARVAQNGTPEEKRRVRAAVARKEGKNATPAAKKAAPRKATPQKRGK